MMQYLKSSDLFRITGRAESTVRKYCQELEKQSYEFEKDGETRLFKSKDLEMIKKVIQLREKTNLKLRHAVTMALTYHQQVTQSMSNEPYELQNSKKENIQHVIQHISDEIMPQFQYITDILQLIRKILEEYSQRDKQCQETIDEMKKELKEMKSTQLIMLQVHFEIRQEQEKIKKKNKKKIFGLF
jgi:arginine utilization protein RocB